MHFLSKSIKNKILLVLVLVFIMMILVTTKITHSNERDMVMELSVDKTEQIARTYFDNINTMMLTGTMAQRSVLRQKLLDTEGFTNAKVIRADAVSKIFGVGNSEQVIEDDLDRQGMKSRETLITRNEDGDHRSVTVIIPMLASKNYKGTNCTTCHVAEEGTLLGTVRVDYSLEAVDKRIDENLWELSWINIIVMLVGLFAITWYFGRVVLNPLIMIRDVMTKNSDDQDLTQCIKIKQTDEIGQVAVAFNQMLEHFSESLLQVDSAVSQLNTSSGDILTSAQKTADATNKQRTETDAVKAAIAQLEQSAAGVTSTAQDVAKASSEADRDSQAGTLKTGEAIEGIHKLVNSIEDASEVILSLDHQSESVGAVLDVIRGIAEQTNLLALNAAIEAARAGEQGRGFAVVADEVRSLATRSHESTEEIERIIEKLQAGAKQAVDVMSQAKQQAEERKNEVQTADDSLKFIADKVKQIHLMNETMNSTIQQQSDITRKVQDSVQNIGSLSEETTNDALHTSHQSNEIVSLTQRLEKLINEFKFRKN